MVRSRSHSPPSPEAPKKRGKGKFITLGCGILALPVTLLIGVCTAIIATSGDDDESETASTEEATEQHEAFAEEEPADEEAPADEDAAAAAEEDEATEEPTEQFDVPTEHASAPGAGLLGHDVHVQAGHLRQLVSDYGDQFPEEQANYAIENLES